MFSQNQFSDHKVWSYQSLTYITREKSAKMRGSGQLNFENNAYICLLFHFHHFYILIMDEKVLVLCEK